MSIKFDNLTLNSVVIDDKGGVLKLTASDSAEITIRVVDPKDLNGLEFGTALDLALTEVVADATSVPSTETSGSVTVEPVVSATTPVVPVSSVSGGTTTDIQNEVANGGTADSSAGTFPTGSVSS